MCVCVESNGRMGCREILVYRPTRKWKRNNRLTTVDSAFWPPSVTWLMQSIESKESNRRPMYWQVTAVPVSQGNWAFRETASKHWYKLHRVSVYIQRACVMRYRAPHWSEHISYFATRNCFCFDKYLCCRREAARCFLYVYTVYQKSVHQTRGETLSILNGFSKFCHYWKEKYISNKNCVILPTIPSVCCRTTLWKLEVRICGV